MTGGWAQASDLAVDGWLWERPGPRDLRSVVRCVWYGDLAEAVVPLPDECIDLCWVDGTVWVSGPETVSVPFRSSAPHQAAGLRFHPGAAGAFVGVSSGELRDRRVPLDDLWGAQRARRLTASLADAPDAEGQVAVLEHAVRALPDRSAADPVAALISDALVGPTARSLDWLVRQAGVSSRELHRRSVAAFGYGPSYLARMRRLHRLLGALRRGSRTFGLAAVAATAGYSDQSHMSREVRALLQATPTELRKTSVCPIRSRRTGAA
jgi:AraC-like DNA-binding protein